MDPTQATGASEPHHERSIDAQAVSYPQDNDQLATDDLFEALSNRRRRQVIRALEDGPREMGAIARAIAAAENDIPVDAVGTDQRKRVYVSLYQAHLDKLDDWGIVEWQEIPQTVAPGPVYDVARDALEAVGGTKSPSWRDRLAGLLPGWSA